MAQTLLRGLDVLDVVARGPVSLTELSRRMGLAKSTAHRLAGALVGRGLLTYRQGDGYLLGPRLLLLASETEAQLDLVQVAHPYVVSLARETEDTVHLGMIDDDQVLYIDKAAGRRRVILRSRIGERQHTARTALGRALLFDADETDLNKALRAAASAGAPLEDEAVWKARMATYARDGFAFDLEENEDQVRCVAAPIRDAAGRIVAALSVSSAAQYMPIERLHALGQRLQTVCGAISADLGWLPKP